MDQSRYRDGRLFCEGLPARELADRFGTPLYIYSRATLEDHYDKIAAAFGVLSPLICYSIKSCSNIHVCRVLAERGAGMDVVSGGELERALVAGCSPEKIVYAGVGKTEAEIRAALGRPRPSERERGSALAGEDQTRKSTGGTPVPPVASAGWKPAPHAPIGYFNIESEPEFEAIAAIARDLGVRTRGALRINPDVDPHTHVYTSTGKKESKFGVDIGRAIAFFERYGRDEFLRLDALHLHIGSPVYETAPYVAAINKALALIDDLARRGFTITTLDIGGGFAADYETDKSPLATDYAGMSLVPSKEAEYSW